MKVYKNWLGQFRIIKLDMRHIEMFFALGHKKLAANKVFLKILSVPTRAKELVEEEIAAQPDDLSIDSLSDLRHKAYLAGIDYYNSDPAEINLAFAAYKQKMCDLGNLSIAATRKAFCPDSEPFAIERKYNRKETFKRFGVMNTDG